MAKNIDKRMEFDKERNDRFNLIEEDDLKTLIEEDPPESTIN